MTKLKIISATLAALAFAGCGSDGGSDGGGGNSSTTVQPSFDGSGAEIEGYYAFKVTAASGIYSEHYYGPVGLTGFVRLSDNGDGTISLERNGLGGSNWSTVTLDPNTANKTYEGSITYATSAGGTYNGEDIDEVWTLNFNGAIANLKVTAGVDDDNDNGTAPVATGAMTIDLQTPWTFEDNEETYFYGKQTAYSSDARYVGQTGITEIYDWNPGTYSYFYVDGTYEESDDLYVEGYWKEGDTLVGGGYYDGSYGSWLDKFGTVRIKLSTAGKPVSATAKIWDTATDAVTNVAHAGYKTVPQIESYVNTDSMYHDLTVTTVTAGGELEGMFGGAGTINTDELYNHGGDHFHANNFPGLSYGYKDGNQWVYVAWDGNAYDDGGVPGYDDDGLGTTQERWTIRFTIDANGFYTGGSAKLQIYDASDVLTSTENMTFTLNAAPVIGSALTASGTQGSAFSYTITGTHSPDSYAAAVLPAGLSVDTGSGAITGTPTVFGTFNVTISATNEAGTDSETLVLTIAEAP